MTTLKCQALKCLSYTCMHLNSGFTFFQYVHSLGSKPMTLVLLESSELNSCFQAFNRAKHRGMIPLSSKLTMQQQDHWNEVLKSYLTAISRALTYSIILKSHSQSANPTPIKQAESTNHPTLLYITECHKIIIYWKCIPSYQYTIK